jgi:hypothetical protein
MSAAAETSDMVLIPAARLKELEEIESKQKAYIGRLKTLHETRDPAEHSKKVLEKYYEKKEEINARRRAAYKAKKAAASTIATAAGSGDSSTE